MKRSFTFYLKTVLLLIGVILIIIAGFKPVTSQLQFKEPENYETLVDTFELGHQNFLWYLQIIFITILFSIGYFFNGLVNRILIYSLTPIFAVIFLFLSAMSMNTWGATPFVPHFEYGYELMCYGSILVITATLISVHRKTKSKATISNSDLLDN